MTTKMECRLTAVGIGVAVVILVLVALGLKGLTVSDGFRDGHLQKMTTRGIIWQTHEGELALKGLKAKAVGESAAMQSTWEFSVYDGETAQALKDVPAGSRVRLYYRQHRWVGPWTGATAYEVYRAESVGD